MAKKKDNDDGFADYIKACAQFTDAYCDFVQQYFDKPEEKESVAPYSQWPKVLAR